MKRVLLVGLLLYLSLTAQDAPPASLHLELGKDTLAVAEPVYVKATIANNMEKDLIINTGHMFNIHNFSRFSLFLITPTGEEWPFVGRRECVSITYSPGDPQYFLLPPNERVTEEFFLYWTYIVPREYQDALEKLSPGNYKIFATYKLPGPSDVRNFVIYSDTVEFVFLSVRYEHLHAIIQMDSLRKLLICSVGGSTAKLYLKSLSESETPYREAAWAELISWIQDPEEFKKEKALFDEVYPESQFDSFLLFSQFRIARRRNRTTEADSLFNLWEQETPHSEFTLDKKFKLRLLTEEERWEQ